MQTIIEESMENGVLKIKEVPAPVVKEKAETIAKLLQGETIVSAMELLDLVKEKLLESVFTI